MRRSGRTAIDSIDALLSGALLKPVLRGLNGGVDPLPVDHGPSRGRVMSEERLQKLISQAGIASRRHAERLILSGRVTVNGKMIRVLGTKATPGRDHIKVDGKLIHVHQPPVYILLNKPKGVITSLSDPSGRPTVIDLLKGVTARVYPVGRLDYDTEGALILTNDGALAEGLMHPRSEIEKVYWAKMMGELTDAQIQRLTGGKMSLPQGRAAPCQIRTLSRSGKNSWAEVTLHEGKKRQVREMLLRVGHPVSKLKRVRYAFLTVEDLPPGHWRTLSGREVARLKKIVLRGPQHARAAHADQH